MDNAFLAQIGMRDADIGMQEARAQMEMDQERRQAQMQLDPERRQLQVQLAELVGLGARAARCETGVHHDRGPARLGLDRCRPGMGPPAWRRMIGGPLQHLQRMGHDFYG